MAKTVVLLFGLMTCWGLTTSRTIRLSRQSNPASQTLWFNLGGNDNQEDNQHHKMSPVLTSNDVSTNDITSTIRHKEPTYNTGNNYGGNTATTYTKTVQPTYPKPVQPTYPKPVQTTYVQPVQPYVKPVQPTYPQPTVQKQYGYQAGNNNYGGDGFSLFDLFED